jgi:hypothetical protein
MPGFFSDSLFHTLPHITAPSNIIALLHIYELPDFLTGGGIS